MAEDRTVETVLETQHTDIVHDTQFDYYGRYVATCSSDRSVKVFSVAQGAKDLVATLNGHEGPVWMLGWAHPRFGTALASCSYDHRAIVWKENQGKWNPVHIIGSHTSSVNALQWAPNEYGMMIATASSDGTVYVSVCAEGSWREPVKVGGVDGVAHPMGAMGVSFAPYTENRVPTLATGGCDGKVRLWSLVESKWTAGVSFSDHKEWIRDVAFNPDSSSQFVTVASCGQDGKVIIRRKEIAADSSVADGDEKDWEVSVTSFTEPVWRLSWSPCGTMLLVTTNDDSCVLTKPVAFTDEWTKAPVSGN